MLILSMPNGYYSWNRLKNFRRKIHMYTVGRSVGWLFNGMSTQKGQFVSTAGRETVLVG